MIIRPEKLEDIADIYRVNREAFGRDNEALLVDKMRDRGVLAVSLVAVEDEKIIGHIAFSLVIMEPEQPDLKAATLAPIAVIPEYQRKGVGTQLMQAGLQACRNLEYEFVVLVGHPEYYPRFGFVSANAKGLKCEFEVPDEAWMVLELKKGSLPKTGLTVKFQPEFAEAV